MKPYLVRLPVFEGPFDLLLFLVRKHEISILDIPVALITEEYMAYLRVLEAFDLEIASEFLVMAAQLLRIKSRMLLPTEEGAAPGEEGEEGDPRAELIRRLLEYKRFKESAAFLEAREQAQRGIFYRSLPPEALARALGAPPEPETYVEVSLYDLVAAFRRASRGGFSEPDAMVIAAETVTVPQKIQELRLHFGDNETFVLSHAIRRHLSRTHFIALFLALLELARMGMIVVLQAEAFAEIRALRVRDLPEGDLDLSQYR